MAKILGIFDKRPLIWFHYILLVGIIIGFYHYMGIHIVHSSIKLIIGLFLVLSIGDQIIHKILKVD